MSFVVVIWCIDCVRAVDVSMTVVGYEADLYVGSVVVKECRGTME